MSGVDKCIWGRGFVIYYREGPRKSTAGEERKVESLLGREYNCGEMKR